MESLIHRLKNTFQLRKHNVEALKVLSEQDDSVTPLILHMTTGSGKTFVMASYIELLRIQGRKNVLVVTPGNVIQRKTINNFTPHHDKYIQGFEVEPHVVHRDNWLTRKDDSKGSTIYVFNIQSLLDRPDSRMKDIHDHLKSIDDLVVITDESHNYTGSAEKFYQTIQDLNPAHVIGLSASVKKDDKVIYSYPLYKAIQDRHVKQPVIVSRKSGYHMDGGDVKQLRDALSILKVKKKVYSQYADINNIDPVKPLLMVTCQSVEQANVITDILSSPQFFGKEESVLQIDHEHDDHITMSTLDNVEYDGSPVEAIVTVSKLKEGWDVKNVAVIVSLRAMTSQILTQQIMGRGLRLPYDKWTDVEHIDQLDIIAHQKFESLLYNEKVLEEFGLSEAVENDDSPIIVEAIDDNDDIEEIVVEKDIQENKKNDVVCKTNLPKQHVTKVISTTRTIVRQQHSSSPAYNMPAPVSSMTPMKKVDNVMEDGEDDSPSTQNNVDNSATIIIREIPDDMIVEEVPGTVTIGVKEKYVGHSFLFPRTIVQTTNLPFQPSDISEETVKKTAENVKNRHLVLERRALLIKQGKIKADKVDSVLTDGDEVEEKTVVKELVNHLLSTGGIRMDSKNIMYLKDIAHTFFDYVNVDKWTTQTVDLAQRELSEMISEALKNHASKSLTQSNVEPIELPSYNNVVVDNVIDLPKSSKDFVRNNYYWSGRRGYHDAYRYDSYSGEVTFMDTIRFDPEVDWWMRLDRSLDNQVYIEYGVKKKYYPDFIVRDINGYYWIVEAKGDRDIDSDDVIVKAEETKKILRMIRHDNRFTDKWGYVLASETIINNSDSWDDIKKNSLSLIEFS